LGHTQWDQNGGRLSQLVRNLDFDLDFLQKSFAQLSLDKAFINNFSQIEIES
jgi:hypothetical protein